MSAAETVQRDDTEIERIEAWRAHALERAGFEQAAAAELAGRHYVDVHVAADLLRKGCPPDLALRIQL